MREHLRRHPVIVFIALTYALTWTPWLSLAATKRTVGDGTSPLYLLGLMGPLMGAVLTTALMEGRQGLRALGRRMLRVRVGWRWWAVAVALPIGLAAAAYVLQIAYSMFLLAPVELPTRSGFGRFAGFPVTGVVLLAVLLVAINGFGEETGWRGFLLPALERRFHPFGASLAVAGIWAAWHAPAFLINDNYRAMPAVMLPMFFFGLVCGSVFLTWLHNRARQSLAVVAVWHGLFNLFTGTVAARALLAPVETTAVSVIAIILVARELRARWRERHGQYADHVLAPG